MTDSPGNEQIQVTQNTQSPAPTGGVSDSGAQKAPVDSGTFLDDKSESPASPADFPSDWREKLAGDDEKYLNKLKRFSSPQDYSKSYREMEKIASSQKKGLPDNPTPEQVAQYRKDNGIPEKASDYDLKFDDGLIVGEEDKEQVNVFLEDMHKQNTPPAQVKSAIASYLRIRDAQAAEFAKNESMHKNETVEALRQEWGPEYQANRNMVVAFLDKQGDGIGDMLKNARDASGRALLNTPQFAKWVANMAREVDPQSTIAHMTGGTGVSAQERIEQIQKIIRDEPERYYKGAEGQKLQDEMSKLSAFKHGGKGKVA